MCIRDRNWETTAEDKVGIHDADSRRGKMKLEIPTKADKKPMTKVEDEDVFKPNRTVVLYTGGSHRRQLFHYIRFYIRKLNNIMMTRRETKTEARGWYPPRINRVTCRIIMAEDRSKHYIVSPFACSARLARKVTCHIISKTDFHDVMVSLYKLITTRIIAFSAVKRVVEWRWSQLSTNFRTITN